MRGLIAALALCTLGAAPVTEELVLMRTALFAMTNPVGGSGRPLDHKPLIGSATRATTNAKASS